jgi:hypothetical protein
MYASVNKILSRENTTQTKERKGSPGILRNFAIREMPNFSVSTKKFPQRLPTSPINQRNSQNEAYVCTFLLPRMHLHHLGTNLYSFAFEDDHSVSIWERENVNYILGGGGGSIRADGVSAME